MLPQNQRTRGPTLLICRRVKRIEEPLNLLMHRPGDPLEVVMDPVCSITALTIQLNRVHDRPGRMAQIRRLVLRDQVEIWDQRQTDLRRDLVCEGEAVHSW